MPTGASATSGAAGKAATLARARALIAVATPPAPDPLKTDTLSHESETFSDELQSGMDKGIPVKVADVGPGPGAGGLDHFEHLRAKYGDQALVLGV